MRHDLVIVGNDPWGATLAKEAADLNLTVALLEQQDRIPNSDNHPFYSRHDWNRYGVDLLRGEVQFIGTHQLLVMHEFSERIIRGRNIVLACGQMPNGRGRTQNLRLDEIGVVTDENHRLWCNPEFQTWVPHIYGMGDVVGYPVDAMEPVMQLDIILEQIRPIDWIETPVLEPLDVNELYRNELIAC